MGVIRVAATVEPFWHPVPGGTAVFLAEILRELAGSDDLEIHGIAARRTEPIPARFDVDVPIHHSRLTRPMLYESWHRFGRPAVTSMIGSAVDVIWAAAMVIPPRTAPVVATVHDLDFLHHPERLSRRGRVFFPQCWEATRSRADIIVCPSQVVADDCAAQGIDPSIVRVVPHGVRTEEATATAVDDAVSRYHLPADFALWVGTVEPRKNLTGLIAAVHRIPDLPLVVVGPDGWNVETSTVAAELDARVTWLGEVPHTDLAAIYRAARVFVFPSLDEGFGLPVLEAMAQGTPVVTSAGTATEEAAGGAAELVDPTSVDSITSGIETVLGDSNHAADLARRGLGRAAEATWARAAAEYRAILRDAACLE